MPFVESKEQHTVGRRQHVVKHAALGFRRAAAVEHKLVDRLSRRFLKFRQRNHRHRGEHPHMHAVFRAAGTVVYGQFAHDSGRIRAPHQIAAVIIDSRERTVGRSRTQRKPIRVIVGKIKIVHEEWSFDGWERKRQFSASRLDRSSRRAERHKVRRRHRLQNRANRPSGKS